MASTALPNDISVDDSTGSAIEEYLHSIRRQVAALRIPELFAHPPGDCLYHMPDRQGISVVAVRTMDLTDAQLRVVMTYRFAQYLTLNFTDRREAFETGLSREPLTAVSANDVHILAGSRLTGEILCYVAMAWLDNAPVDATVGSVNRPLFPVEQVHGAGLFNRLQVLPDLPVRKVCEMARFVKNQFATGAKDLLVRAPIEVLVATAALLRGVLHPDADAVIGDLEEGITQRNLEYFHVPFVVLHGTVPYTPPGAYKYCLYRHRNFYPFAFLNRDLVSMRERVTAIEHALEQPDRAGMLALRALKLSACRCRTSIEPEGGLPPLLDLDLPLRRDEMSRRRELLERGHWLRTLALFSDLSLAEAAMLGSLLEQRTYAAGMCIVSRGDSSNDLMIVLAGEVASKVGGDAGNRGVERLRIGDYFGETAMLLTTPQPATMFALTPVTLLVLNRDNYMKYLAGILSVHQQLLSTAAARAAATVRPC